MISELFACESSLPNAVRADEREFHLAMPFEVIPVSNTVGARRKTASGKLGILAEFLPCTFSRQGIERPFHVACNRAAGLRRLRQ